jgi:hypothetical protein
LQRPLHHNANNNDNNNSSDQIIAKFLASIKSDVTRKGALDYIHAYMRYHHLYEGEIQENGKDKDKKKYKNKDSSNLVYRYDWLIGDGDVQTIENRIIDFVIERIAVADKKLSEIGEHAITMSADISLDSEARVASLNLAAEIQKARMITILQGPTWFSQSKGYAQIAQSNNAQEMIDSHLRLVKNGKKLPSHYEPAPTSTAATSLSNALPSFNNK